MPKGRPTADESLEQLKEKLREGPDAPYVPTEGVSTGNTLLNLACSGRAEWGFPVGSYIFLVGDAASGKTFESLTCFAEAAINPYFDDYNFIYDGPEFGALMDLKKFFGRAASRIKPPWIKGQEKTGFAYSKTVEEFFFNLDDHLKTPCIYVLDSTDSLKSNEEIDKFDERKNWVRKGRKGREPSGSYGMSKPKDFSAMLRQVPAKLKESKSILIMICQTRDNIGFGSQFQPKTRAGGNALTFYSDLELWSSVKEKIKKTERGHDIQVGSVCKVKVKRSRITGRENEVLLPIYWASGFDDVGGMVNWLIDWKFWKESGDVVETGGFINENSADVEGTIKRIESEGLENQLKQLVTDKWQEVAKAVAVGRKNKYALTS